MEWVKTTAKTVPEAIDLALDNLGVDESEAEIVILEEPRSGLFGRLRGTARVEARIKPKPIRPKVERNRGGKNRSEGGGRNRKRNRSGDRSGRSRSDGERSSGNRSEGGRSEGSGNNRSGDGGGQSRSGNRNRGGRNRNRSNDNRNRQQNGPSRDRDRGRNSNTTDSGGDVTTNPNEGASVEDVVTHLRTFLTDLTEAFGFDGDVTVDESEEGTVVGRIEGRHGLLVGPKGRTLDAVQELARISCQRATPSDLRIKVDVGGYRQQRAAALADFAEKAAERAVADGNEVALEPMSAADRKAVHDALNGDDRVETRSAGTDPRRRVVVVPVLTDDEEDDDVDDSVNGAADDADLDTDETFVDEAGADEEE